MYNRSSDSNGTPSGKSLAAQDAVSTFVSQMLTIASAGGMTEHRAEELYNEIMGYYGNLDAAGLDCFRRDFLTILYATNVERN